MIINNGPIGSAKFNPLKDLKIIIGSNEYYPTTAGVANVYKFAQDAAGKKWEIAILTSCEVQFRKNLKKCDIFLVGGGASGQTGDRSKFASSDKDGWKGGDGGKGGGLLTQNNIEFLKQSYQFKVGNSNENTQINDIYIAAGGGGSESGGLGAWFRKDDWEASYEGRVSTSGKAGKKAFNNTGSIIPGYETYQFGASGGGGGKALGNADNGSNGGSNGGGRGGGYSGGNYGSYRSPTSGDTNSGSGGGGGCAPGTWNTTGQNGGAGGSGIIILRGYLK